MNDDFSFDDAVSYMGSLGQWGIRLDRDRFMELLRRLNSPHEKWQAIHVAGTNGKGSTTTFIASVLARAGYKTGAYLSPYVFDVRERILLNGAMIAKADFARLVGLIRPHIEAIQTQTDLGQTTEFELKTAVAFCYFAQQGVDFAIVEVGIGGRLDATNVIPPPLVSVITSIGLDHVPLLGTTRAQIAGEKAGIIKRGTLACITAVGQNSEAMPPLLRKAYGENVPLLRVATKTAPKQTGPENALAARELSTAFVTCEALPGGLTRLTGPSAFLPFGLPPLPIHLRLGLRGPFQAANAGAAFAALSVLQNNKKAKINSDALLTGLEKATLPGRFQIVRKHNKTLILDVAHNDDGARVLADALQAELSAAGTIPRSTLVVGLSRSHNAEPFLGILAPLFEKIIVTAPAFRPKPAHETRHAALLAGANEDAVSLVEPAGEAIAQAWDDAPRGGVVVVTGSFYTVGETPQELL